MRNFFRFAMKSIMGLILFVIFSVLILIVWGDWEQEYVPYRPLDSQMESIFVFADYQYSTEDSIFPDSETAEIMNYLLGRADLSEKNKIRFVYYRKERAKSLADFGDSIENAPTSIDTYFLPSDVSNDYPSQERLIDIYNHCGRPRIRFEPNPDATFVYLWNKDGLYWPLNNTLTLKSIFESHIAGNYFSPDPLQLISEISHAIQFHEKPAFAYSGLLKAWTRVLCKYSWRSMSTIPLGLVPIDTPSFGEIYNDEYDISSSMEFDAHSNIQYVLDGYYLQSRIAEMNTEDTETDFYNY